MDIGLHLAGRLRPKRSALHEAWVALCELLAAEDAIFIRCTLHLSHSDSMFIRNSL